ncbi:hypothetical protein PTSG_12216 [Salpingoeca rosetta]|uniref:Uncharacterized protein n=1 Tax=Salpingoeca rosetta (strain ATCC 50818 / BSB-021) TaxID=946362 RepID=F2U9R6_SALR5|nr:uncharacterized protein PTSG_12216 [Salpingoeca rosetta]EGD73093.1 hypothetical protein PTSG_12216 [Salpingoeca rosetta]|eukprot:XP_004994124.1 hypothetical protein PTSG_12216 [Salpingoeca rosetta]
MQTMSRHLSVLDKALACEIYGVSVLCGRCSTCIIRAMLNTCDTWFAGHMSPAEQCKFLIRLLKRAAPSFLEYASVLISPLTNRDVLYTVGNRTSATNDARQAMAMGYMRRHSSAMRPLSSHSTHSRRRNTASEWSSIFGAATATAPTTTATTSTAGGGISERSMDGAGGGGRTRRLPFAPAQQQLLCLA